MNKKLLTTAIVTMMALSTGVAMAAPVTIDGSASYRYRHDTNSIGANQDGSIFRFTLNAKTDLTSNLSLFGRLATESLTNENCGKDFGFEKNTAKSIVTIDQFGFIYNNSNFTYKLGKQAAFIGGTGLLYDSTGYLGNHNGLTGINVTGKTGVTSLDVFAGRENNVAGDNNKVYSVRASFNPVKDLTLGATLAQYDAAKDATFYAVDAAYTQGKATYSAEYAKSNADNNNTGYDIGVSYAFDDKNSVSITNYNVKDNGSIAGMTSYEVGKGYYYSYSHKFDKTTSASLFYRDFKETTGNKNTSLRATVNYNF